MGTTTFRRPSTRVAVLIISVIAYLVLVFQIEELVDGPVQNVLIGLLIGLLVMAVLQTWRLAVVLRPDGVLVRNSWRDRFLPWNEIRGIDHEASHIQRVSFLMADGRVVPCDAMRGWAFGDEPNAKALVQAVTTRLADQEQQTG
ncbi:PH domain-containing protein [Lentzea sp.]|uniref:PH domain-containing protein n=1 Tax=Lentzea sp. TaxID=56099 RepID=UPI002B8DC312|nr:PH domain-containing protein [Lentzea sp.]HUQ57550.1 PH domain-containing protein [Lentzea sp.]